METSTAKLKYHNSHKAKTEQETRSKRIEVKLTPSEHTALHRQAKILGITASDLVRENTFEKQFTINPQTEQYLNTLSQLTKELSPIGNNVNQVARQINTAIASKQKIPRYIDHPDCWRELNNSIMAIAEIVNGLITENTTKPRRKRRNPQ